MSRALAQAVATTFLSVVAYSIGPVFPALAQDPQTLFGGDKPTPAAAPPKAAAQAAAQSKPAPAKKAPASSPAASAKAATAAPANPAGSSPVKVSPAVHSNSAAAAPKHSVSNTKSAAAAKVAPVHLEAPASEPAESAKTEEKIPAKAATSASHPAHKRPAATTASAAERHPAHTSGPPPASPAQVRAFCGKLWNKVQNNWEFATGKNHVILGVDVDSSGNVVGTQASSQPKNAEAEAKAQEALTKSQPLDPLPTGLPSAHLTITLDSTADPHGDSSSSGSVRLEYNPGAVHSSASHPQSAAPAGTGAPGGSGAPGAADAPGASTATTPAQQ